MIAGQFVKCKCDISNSYNRSPTIQPLSVKHYTGQTFDLLGFQCQGRVGYTYKTMYEGIRQGDPSRTTLTNALMQCFQENNRIRHVQYVGTRHIFARQWYGTDFYTRQAQQYARVIVRILHYWPVGGSELFCSPKENIRSPRKSRSILSSLMEFPRPLSVDKCSGLREWPLWMI